MNKRPEFADRLTDLQRREGHASKAKDEQKQRVMGINLVKAADRLIRDIEAENLATLHDLIIRTRDLKHRVGVHIFKLNPDDFPPSTTVAEEAPTMSQYTISVQERQSGFVGVISANVPVNATGTKPRILWESASFTDADENKARKAAEEAAAKKVEEVMRASFTDSGADTP